MLRREDKYKAKSLLDTFGYRAGDALGAYLERVLAMLGAGLFPLAGCVLVLVSVWLLLCAFLARAQARLAILYRPTAPGETSRLVPVSRGDRQITSE